MNTNNMTLLGVTICAIAGGIVGPIGAYVGWALELALIDGVPSGAGWMLGWLVASFAAVRLLLAFFRLRSRWRLFVTGVAFLTGLLPSQCATAYHAFPAPP